MRDDLVLLLEILLASRKIAKFLEEKTKKQVRNDDMVRSAVERQTEIMGEASRIISKSFKNEHTEVSWRRPIKLRNYYIHVYHLVKGEEVWRSAKTLVPLLEKTIA